MTVCCTVLCALSWPRLMSKTGMYMKLKVLFKGIYFLPFLLKKIHYFYKKKKTEVVKETRTFDQTNSSEQCVQKDRLR